MKKLLYLSILIAGLALADEEALTKCRQIDDIAERVDCYDGIVDSSFPVEKTSPPETAPPPEITSPPATSETTAVPDEQSLTVPNAQSLFGKTSADANRIVEASLAIEQISQIEAKVTDVRKSAQRKITVTLDNGQIWRQLDNRRLPLKSGETVIVRKASLSSFLMEKQSGSRSIRVKRVN